MSSELITKNFIQKLSKDNFESFLFNLEDDTKKLVFDICIDLKLLQVSHIQKLVSYNNLEFFSVKALVDLIPLLIDGGELKLSQEFIREAYKRISQKNLLNHVSKISSLRKEYFPKDIDLGLVDFSIYLLNQDYAQAIVVYKEIKDLLDSNWRKVSHSKPKEFYLEQLDFFINSVKDKNADFFKLYSRSSLALTGIEKMQYLILSSVDENELKIALEFLDIERQSPKVAVKKVQVTKVDNDEPESEESFGYINLKNLIHVTETERNNLIDQYLKEEAVETNESYVLTLLDQGHFDDIQRKSDLVMTFFELGYEKAIERILEIYHDLETKLTFAQLLVRDGRVKEAKAIAAEVLVDAGEDLSLIEWANRLIDKQ